MKPQVRPDLVEQLASQNEEYVAHLLERRLQRLKDFKEMGAAEYVKDKEIQLIIEAQIALDLIQERKRLRPQG